jgi:glycosyl hydrolase family 31
VRAWLPPGRWTDVFTGLTYRGGTTILLHRDLDTIPVLAPAGAILPLAGDVEFGSANPEALELRVFAGADGEFTLAEDQDDERWAFTRFTLMGDELRIHPVEGEHGSVPATRRYDVVLCGFADVPEVAIAGLDGATQPTVPGTVPGSVSIRLPSVAAGEGVVLRLVGDAAPAGNRDIPERLFALLDAAQIELMTKERVYRAVTHDSGTAHEPARAVPALAALDLPHPLFAAVVELLLAECG